MKRLGLKPLGIIWFLFVLVFVSLMFTASFFLTGYLYKITGLVPALWESQVITSLLGLTLTALMAGAAGRIARARGWIPERNVFRPIIDALEQIARGDFSVRLENGVGDHQMVGELAKSVNRMALELDQMENMRQEFISNVSHEIQSPLTSIRGFAQALENDQLGSEERHHYLSIIESESTRLSRITDDLLKMASLESDHVRFERKPFRLDKQVRSLILASEPQWVQKGIDMDVSLQEIKITANEDLLSQVWVNLINNSIKFTPQNGKVKIDLCRVEDKVEFNITDNGIGISEEDQAHIFERFYKADRSRTHSNGGSGLGLSISRKIVEMHHGTISVMSRPGSGTSFTVRLPLQ